MYLFIVTALILMFFVQNSILSRVLPTEAYSASSIETRQENQERFQNLKVNMQQFLIPNNESWPLYPLFDHDRNLIWVGDTVIDSGRIWEFNITNAKFKEHNLNDTSIVTILAPHEICNNLSILIYFIFQFRSYKQTWRLQE